MLSKRDQIVLSVSIVILFVLVIALVALAFFFAHSRDSNKAVESVPVQRASMLEQENVLVTKHDVHKEAFSASIAPEPDKSISTHKHTSNIVVHTEVHHSSDFTEYAPSLNKPLQQSMNYTGKDQTVTTTNTALLDSIKNTIKKDKINKFNDTYLEHIEASLKKHIINNGDFSDNAYKKFLKLLSSAFPNEDKISLDEMKNRCKERFRLIRKGNLLDKNFVLATYLDASGSVVNDVILLGENFSDYLQSAKYKRSGRGGLAMAVADANKIFLEYADENLLKPPRLTSSFITMLDHPDERLSNNPYLSKMLVDASNIQHPIQHPNNLNTKLDDGVLRAKVFTESAFDVIMSICLEMHSTPDNTIMLKPQLWAVLANMCELRRLHDLLDSGLVLASASAKELIIDNKNHKLTPPFGVGLGVAYDQTARYLHSTIFLQESLASIVVDKKIKYWSLEEIWQDDHFSSILCNKYKITDQEYQALINNLAYFITDVIQDYWKVSLQRCNEEDLQKILNDGKVSTNTEFADVIEGECDDVSEGEHYDISAEENISISEKEGFNVSEGGHHDVSVEDVLRKGSLNK